MGLNQARIIEVFNSCFRTAEQTWLIGGANEPWYERAKGDNEARLYCRADYAASALHEVAHWCLATQEQRMRDDFGFTYLAPPRTLAAQRAFFQLELPVQSLESLFADAAGIEFKVSADSFDPSHAKLISEFAGAVACYRTTTEKWLESEAGSRAKLFADALARVER